MSKPVRLWNFTMPPEANYARFFMTVKDKTVEVRFQRESDGAIGVAVWGDAPPPIFLDEVMPASDGYVGETAEIGREER
jgi:hypothetical protein